LRHRTFIIVGFAGVLLGLGLLFVGWRTAGAAIFGLPVESQSARPYLMALGFRDLGLGSALILVSLFSTRKATGLVLAATAIIPFCDMGLLLWENGWSAGPSLALHGLSGVLLVGMSGWSWMTR